MMRNHRYLAVLTKMARPERFELPTAWFVARYSIQLSYGRLFRKQQPFTERSATGGELYWTTAG